MRTETEIAMVPRQQAGERGFVMVTLFVVMIPLLICVVAFSSTMSGRNTELRTELEEELALLAAESGVDDAIYQGRIGNLSDGGDYTRSLGNGMSFKVEPTHLEKDSQDNDGDSQVDEKDEDVFQVIVTGTYRQTTRRIAAYLGPVPLLPPLEAAVTLQDPNIQIKLNGTPFVSGHNKDIDGNPGAAPDVKGLAITPPGTQAHLLSELSAIEQAQVVGEGPTPSIGTASSVDLTVLVPQIQNIADLVLTSPMYANFNFGDGSAGTAKITYRNGNVTFGGNSRGAGILVVTGDLHLSGTFRFDGVIIILGKLVNNAGTAQVYGAMVQGPSGGLYENKGTLDVHYSAEAIALANSVSGRYVAFIGWQELARK